MPCSQQVIDGHDGRSASLSSAGSEDQEATIKHCMVSFDILKSAFNFPTIFFRNLNLCSSAVGLSGGYDPSHYANLKVTPDITELFSLIMKLVWFSMVSYFHMLLEFLPCFLIAISYSKSSPSFFPIDTSRTFRSSTRNSGRLCLTTYQLSVTSMLLSRFGLWRRCILSAYYFFFFLLPSSSTPFVTCESSETIFFIHVNQAEFCSTMLYNAKLTSFFRQRGLTRRIVRLASRLWTSHALLSRVCAK